MAAFIDSPLRRLIFPYLEGSDSEDPNQPHWMSNLTRQALGVDSNLRSSSSSSSSSTSSRKTSGRTIAASASHNHFITADSADTERHHPHHWHHQMYDTPWTVMYLNQHKGPVHPSDDLDSDGESDAEVSQPGSSHSRSNHGNVRPKRSSSAPADANATQAQSQTQPQPPVPATAGISGIKSSSTSSLVLARKRSSTAPELSPKLRTVDDTFRTVPRGRQSHRRRQQSLGQPLAPAQPLPQVNTVLPLKLPPIGLRARESDPLDKLVSESTLANKGPVTSSNITKTQSFLPLHTSSSSSSLNSISSNGSFHGDAGDDNPEEQLAAKVATLRESLSSEPSATAVSHVDAAEQCQATAPTTTMTAVVQPTTQTQLDEHPDTTNDDPTVQEIAQYAGIFGCLADMFLELKLVSRGPFRARASSEAVLDERPHIEHTINDAPTQGPRSQSVDVLDERMPTAEKHSMMSSYDKSTPGSLRAEVKAWSSGRRRGATSSSASVIARDQPGTMHPSRSFIQGLLSRTSSLRNLLDFNDVSDGGDDGDNAEDSTEGNSSNLTSFPSTLDDSLTKDQGTSSDDDVGEEDEDDEAYTSLWASPIISRSSSHYNLTLHSSDEPCAFEEEEETIKGLWEGATAAFQPPPSPPRRRRYGDKRSGMYDSKRKRGGSTAADSLKPLTTTTSTTTTTTTTNDGTKISTITI